MQELTTGLPLLTSVIQRRHLCPHVAVSWTSIARLATLVLSSMLVAACGKDRTPNDTQVAVRVNQSEISVHQVQAILKQQPRLPPDAAGDATARVLEVLIDQELAAQAARQQGLDGDPGVIQALEASKRDILARAYHDRVVANVVGPSSDEIDRYYDEHPALFAQRRIYVLQESAVEADEAQMSQLRSVVAGADGSDQLGKSLREAGFRYTSRQLAHAAEDLPFAILESISKLEPGRSAFFPQQGGARLFTVLQARLAPVDRRTAAGPISAFLAGERKRELVSRAMKSLRDGAKLEYQGTFAGTAPAAAPQ